MSAIGIIIKKYMKKDFVNLNGGLTAIKFGPDFWQLKQDALQAIVTFVAGDGFFLMQQRIDGESYWEFSRMDGAIYHGKH